MRHMTVGQETSCQESGHVPQGVCRDTGGTRSVASLPFAEGFGGVPPNSWNSLESPFGKGGRVARQVQSA